MGLLSACSGGGIIGSHRIDVQQGNALDQESVAKLKPGLNRSQVRFLLGTPLLVDPFRNDRWDYVYVYYKAGRLTEQKHITLFFEGDILKNIEGDFPVAEPLVAKLDTPKPAPAVAVPTPVEPVPMAQGAGPASQVAVKVEPAPVKPEPLPEAVGAAPVAKAAVTPPSAEAEPAATAKPLPAPAVAAAAAPVVATPVAATPVAAMAQTKPVPPAPVVDVAPAPVAATRTESSKAASSPRTPVATSLVPPLPSPKGAPAYVDPRPQGELNLQTDANVAQIQPDVIPPFPEPSSAAVSAALPNAEEGVLQALKSWSEAWKQRNMEAYLAAYGQDFVAQGGVTRADWEKHRRLLIGQAKNIDLKIDSPSVEIVPDGSALVTFNQYYRSDRYRDAVVKQIRMVQRDGHWLITEERVLSTLHPKKP